VTQKNPLQEMGGGYIQYQDKLYKKEALQDLAPSLFSAKADYNKRSINTNFGTQFPKYSNKGDVFVRVDVLPNKVFRFDGKKWIEINKSVSSSYLSDQNYIDFLVDKVKNREYDLDSLSSEEKDLVEERIRNQKS
jgi:hypothetical protein